MSWQQLVHKISLLLSLQFSDLTTVVVHDLCSLTDPHLHKTEHEENNHEVYVPEGQRVINPVNNQEDEEYNQCELESQNKVQPTNIT